MKGVTITFIVLEMIARLVLNIVGGIAFLPFLWLFIILNTLTLILGIMGICYTGSNKKSVALGVFVLLFNGLIGGILYLCWKPKVKPLPPVQNQQ